MASIFDDEDKLFDELKERIKDENRIGSYFKFSVFNRSYQYEIGISRYFDLNKLEAIANEIQWLPNNHFTYFDDKIIGSDDDRFAKSLSKIIFNQVITTGGLLDMCKNGEFVFQKQSIFFNEEIENVRKIVYDIMDERYRDDMKFHLYIYKNESGCYILQFFIKNNNDNGFSILYNYKNSKK